MKVFSGLLFLIFFFSCGEDAYKIEKKAKVKADSLFQIEYQTIIREQDSLCMLRNKSVLPHLLDSIVEVRKIQIIQLQKGL
jgi:hypothetical protein